MLVPVSQVRAVSLSVSHVPTTVDRLTEFEVDVVLSCSSCSGDSYLRGVLYPSGTNYFGFTKNNEGTWINAPGGECAKYYKVMQEEIVEGSWSGKLTMKPDVDHSAFQGPGEYLLKIGRYTPSCGVTWSDPLPLTLAGPTVTPTPAPTAKPTEAPRPTDTPSPTHTPMPSATPTPTDVPESPTTEPTSSEGAPPAILGEQTQQASGSIGSGDTGTMRHQLKRVAIGMLCLGAGSALLAAGISWKRIRKTRHE
jgi:hypothetical protein